MISTVNMTSPQLTLPCAQLPGLPSAGSAERRCEIIVRLALVLAILAAFFQASRFGFIYLDDRTFVANNPQLRHGFTGDAIRWAFTADLLSDSPNADYWQPVTLLSRIIDVQLFGLNATGHHFVNVTLHILNVLLLFGWLRRTTAALWPSALVAALFAVHPLQVEPVAWVSARKDVLSAFFIFLTVWVYTGYVQKPSVRRYLPTLGIFALALMSKPMAVTLPVLLLLLDCWPFQRLRKSTIRPLLAEKIPLLLMSGVVAAIAKLGQPQALSHGSLFFYVIYIPASYGWYLAKTSWPADLIVRSTGRDQLFSHWQIVTAVAVLLAVTITVLRQSKRRPFLAVGWFWFLVALAPAVGLMPHGDRFMYLPIVGLLITGVWAGNEFGQRWPTVRPVLASLGAIMVLGCLVASWRQVQYWRSSAVLFGRALTLDPDNWVAHACQGAVALETGDPALAVRHLREAQRLNPSYMQVYTSLAEALQQQGRQDEAIAVHREALHRDPQYAPAHTGLANLLAAQGRTQEALSHFEVALRIRPDSAEAHHNLGKLLADLRRLPDAVTQYEEALQLDPGDPETHYNLANVLAQQQRTAEAIRHYEDALRTRPGYAQARVNLGNVLWRGGHVNDAITQYREALRTDPNLFEAQFNLGEALRGRGELDAAIQHLREAIRLQPDLPEPRQALAQTLEQKGKPTTP